MLVSKFSSCPNMNILSMICRYLLFWKRNITFLQFHTESEIPIVDESALFLLSNSPKNSNSSLKAYIFFKSNLFLSDLLSHENAATLNDVKTLVQQLYTTLCIEQHQLSKERELIERLEDLKEQLAPLEKVQIQTSDFSLHWYFFSEHIYLHFKFAFLCNWAVSIKLVH